MTGQHIPRQKDSLESPALLALLGSISRARRKGQQGSAFVSTKMLQVQ